MSKHPLKLALIAVAFLAGCASPPRKVFKPQALDLNTFARKWAADMPKGLGPITAVYVREDLVFAYTRGGTSVVINRADGSISHVETVPGGSDVLHGPVVFKETIVYPTLTSLQVYDRKGGRFNRTSKLPFAIRTNAVGAKNMVFVGADYTGGGRMVALDLAREYVPTRWQLMFPRASVSAAPAVFGDTVYCASEDGSVTAVATENRAALWPLPDGGVFHTGGPVFGDVAADENGVYVSSSDSKLYCLNRTTGKVKWQYYAETELREGPVVTKDLVFQIVNGKGLVAIDKTEGIDKNKPPAYDRQPRWTVRNARQLVAEDEKFAYLRRTDNTILAADKMDGHIAFRSKRKDFVAFAANNKDGTIYAATRDGQLLAVQAVTKPGMVGELVLNPPPAMSDKLVASAR